MFLKNYSGTLYYEDIPLVYFNIENGELKEYRKCKEDLQYFPYELARIGFTYKAFNLFFRERVVLDGSQDIREYLNALDLEYYDFEKIVKINKGRNFLDNWSVR